MYDGIVLSVESDFWTNVFLDIGIVVLGKYGVPFVSKLHCESMDG